uniref:Uncharacterized protein n=1 Tax=Anguilla anguilla TaxID=7936 RepID=A0A0E9TAW8_ANGAN
MQEQNILLPDNSEMLEILCSSHLIIYKMF